MHNQQNAVEVIFLPSDRADGNLGPIPIRAGSLCTQHVSAALGKGEPKKRVSSTVHSTTFSDMKSGWAYNNVTKETQ